MVLEESPLETFLICGFVNVHDSDDFLIIPRREEMIRCGGRGNMNGVLVQQAMESSGVREPRVGINVGWEIKEGGCTKFLGKVKRARSNSCLLTKRKSCFLCRKRHL
jgi:hypothetical protein